MKDEPCNHVWTRQVTEGDNIIDPPLPYICIICGATATEEELDEKED